MRTCKCGREMRKRFVLLGLGGYTEGFCPVSYMGSFRKLFWWLWHTRPYTISIP